MSSGYTERMKIGPIEPAEIGLFRTHRYVVLGQAGAVQVMLWEIVPGAPGHGVLHYVPGLREKDARGHLWQAADTSFHSPRPLASTEAHGGCELLPGEQCWSWVSALPGIDVLPSLLATGQLSEPSLWEFLEGLYAELAQAV